MEHNNIFKNKLYFSLLCAWLGLFLAQMVLSFANIRGSLPTYLLAILNALLVAAIYILGYVKQEKFLRVIPEIYALVQILLFLLSIPGMITGKDILPKLLQCLFHVPGYGLLAGGYAWRWVFAAFWGSILFSGGEDLGRKLKEDIKALFRRNPAGKRRK